MHGKREPKAPTPEEMLREAMSKGDIVAVRAALQAIAMTETEPTDG